MSDRAKLHVDTQKLMSYLCKDARASFSSILALRLMAIIIATSYWCSIDVAIHSLHCTVHQHIVCVRRSSCFSAKLQNSLLHTYSLQIVLILTLYTIEYEGSCRIVFIRRQFDTWPIWSNAWLTHGMDCHRVSLMTLSTSRRMAEVT